MARRELVRVGDLEIAVTRDDVKHVHLSVHPPDGRVTLVAPAHTRLDVARAYAISKLDWIGRQQTQLREQAREPPRRYVTRETHYIWGQACLLEVATGGEGGVRHDHDRLIMTVPPDANQRARAKVMDAFYREQLHAAVPEAIARWAARLGVACERYYLQRMTTKWGSCNPRAQTIRLNTELAKKPRHLLEYVVAHELAHLIEAGHGPRFVAVLDEHFPTWREARAELNALPLSSVRG